VTEAPQARPPVASVLIPTWDAADTLPLAVDSARRQTESDIEIVVVGDGVTPATRRAVEPLVELDDRVRFLDLPKAPGRGERNRHAGVLECRSDLVVYLADDDLLLPWHVAQVAEAFATADLVQSLNGYVDAEDRLRLWPTDLAEPRWREWHLREPSRNRVSITGTAHSRAVYLSLEQGWVEPPPGSWADLTLWQQFFRLPDLRAVTLRRVSTLQFPAPVRRARDPEAIAASYGRWHAVVCDPDAATVVADLQRAAEWDELVRLSAEGTDREIELAQARSALAAAEEARARAEEARARADEASALLAREVLALRAAPPVRQTPPARGLLSRLRRARHERG
jgi:hypothetical protein